MLRKIIFLLILFLCLTDISEASLKRLTAIKFPDSAENIFYVYDSAGKVMSMSDPSGITNYAYDNSNRLTKETKTIEGKTFNTSYSYTLSGALTSITYPSGRMISYVYDSNGRVVKATETKDGKTTEIITSVSYNVNGTVSAITYGNGILTEKGYDIVRKQKRGRFYLLTKMRRFDRF